MGPFLGLSRDAGQGPTPVRSRTFQSCSAVTPSRQEVNLSPMSVETLEPPSVAAMRPTPPELGHIFGFLLDFSVLNDPEWSLDPLPLCLSEVNQTEVDDSPHQHSDKDAFLKGTQRI